MILGNFEHDGVLNFILVFRGCPLRTLKKLRNDASYHESQDCIELGKREQVVCVPCMEWIERGDLTWGR